MTVAIEKNFLQSVGQVFDPISLCTHELLHALLAHAREAFPDECCGLVHRSGRIRRCVNCQNELHAESPREFPHDARTAFHLAPADQLALAQSFDSDDPTAILYHSHPDGGTKFSAADLAGATFEGTPLYPGVSYLILGLPPSAISPQTAALYQWREGAIARILYWPNLTP